jgi:hypothetical protein
MWDKEGHGVYTMYKNSVKHMRVSSSVWSQHMRKDLSTGAESFPSGSNVFKALEIVLQAQWVEKENTRVKEGFQTWVS